ncbi:sodium-coupled monocarboxylate transporter 1 [Drosophila guanche]|uniref:Blast:Sodium-coupled monocarboxylate transporter 1 n=1 Tax=Drosophila guanche TaxID=7266 RepID=A0A3B0J7V2_DROGU|nr:sodium-coupled monocarboxylate transporter 1 [Drosophila guanche]SPP78364.1 blast:Sodium-coupled monocarboxylate transporter 1 [Drosophila guanche]
MHVEELRASLQSFGWPDYLVFCMMLAICAVIGIYFCLQLRRESRKQRSSGGAEEAAASAASYLVGGRQMKIFPITMSLISSFISGITLLGTPTEVYLYGAQYMYIMGSLVLMGFCMYYFFLPVFHELNLISTYKYLEQRYNRSLRLFGSVMFIVASLLWLPIVIYVPAIAFNQATGVNIHIVTPIVCVVCIFYTCIGGLKAVVWTDVIQTIIMFGAMALVLIKGTLDIGGPSVVWQRAQDTARLERPNFTPDITERYTFYSLVLGGVAHWLKSNAISQNMIQRYLSLPTLRDARIAIWTFIAGVLAFLMICGYTGLLIYATYAQCDPLETKLAQRNDQLLPLLVMETLGSYPGLPGVFVAGVFSAALSSLSTGLNSLSAVVLEDFVKTFRRQPLTEGQTAFVMRSVVVVFGIVFVALVFAVEKLGAVLQLTITLSSVANGPLLGIFTAGVMLPWVNSKGALLGGFSSLLVMAWMCVSAQRDLVTGNLVYQRKPYSTMGCNYTFAGEPRHFASLPLDGAFSHEVPSGPFQLYRISYLYFTLFGALLTIVVALVTSLLLRETDLDAIDTRLLTPFVRRWLERRRHKQSQIPTRTPDGLKPKTIQETAT